MTAPEVLVLNCPNPGKKSACPRSTWSGICSATTASLSLAMVPSPSAATFFRRLRRVLSVIKRLDFHNTVMRTGLADRVGWSDQLSGNFRSDGDERSIVTLTKE